MFFHVFSVNRKGDRLTRSVRKAEGEKGVFRKISLFSFLLALCLLTGAALFSGCDMGGGDPYTGPGGTVGPLVGYWYSGTDGYAINNTILSYNDGSDGQWGMSYAGIIRHVSNFSLTSGVLIVEYTSAPVMPYTTTEPANFIGVYYRIQGPNEVKLANSYDTTGTATPDLAAAIAKFTQAEESTFVYSWDGVAVQIRQATPALAAAPAGDDYGAAVTDY
jgi:hypothetical protein